MHVHVPAANPFYSTRSAWIAFCISFCPFFRPSIFFQLPPVRFLLSRSFSFLSLSLSSFSLAFALQGEFHPYVSRYDSRTKYFDPVNADLFSPVSFSAFSFVFFFFLQTLSPVVRQISFLFCSDASRIYRFAGIKLRGRGMEFIRISFCSTSTSRRFYKFSWILFDEMFRIF